LTSKFDFLVSIKIYPEGKLKPLLPQFLIQNYPFRFIKGKCGMVNSEVDEHCCMTLTRESN